MSQALYRRYRPESFEEVIGQEHVTAPLMQALRSNRVNHAYLFSGPRGCGKTTSARILARILNCAENTEETPRATPCGVCESCTELGRGGSGSLDVVEIDAASHGGVDDARDLRERATFSPSRDRFKIFILDEAHMVTSAGFNALLKIVEEPPPYLKFIFATTEPEKVIGTIRSRTHHYPFRLVPPEVLQGYLAQLCDSEDVSIGQGVLPLVVRAGGGSVRDSLSILDQLMAGALGTGVDYEMAVGLLGFTPVTLLDDVVEALAASDGSSLFRVVDQIIATGHEPRRFVEDLLERLRDLVVIAIAGDRAAAVFSSTPEDQFSRMETQAGNLGLAELSRAADVVNEALTEMTGATSPRLHLELLCARLLLPATDSGVRGIAARLERLERGATAITVEKTDVPAVEQSGSGVRLGSGRPASTRSGSSRSGSGRPAVPQSVPEVPAPAVPEALAQPASVPPLAEETSVAEAVVATEVGIAPNDASADAAGDAPGSEIPADAADTAGVGAVGGSAVGVDEVGADTVGPDAPVASEDSVVAPAVSQETVGGGADQHTEVLRHRWPEVMEALSERRKVTWSLVKNAQIASLDATVLTLSFSAEPLTTRFGADNAATLVSESIKQALGFDIKVEAMTAGAAASPASVSGGIPVSVGASTPTGTSAPTGTPVASEAPRVNPPAAVRGAAEATSSQPEVPRSVVSQNPPRRGAASGKRGQGPAIPVNSVIDPAAAAASWDVPTPQPEDVQQLVRDLAEVNSVESDPEPAPPELPQESRSEYDSDGIPLAEPPPEDTSGPVENHELETSSQPTSTSVPSRSVAPASSGESAASGSGPSFDQLARESAASRAASREAAKATKDRRIARGAMASGTSETAEDVWDSVDDTDTVTGSGLVGAPLIAQMLGGVVIDHSPDEGF